MSEMQPSVQPTQENEAQQNREPGRMRRFLGKIRSMANTGDIKIMGFKDRVVDTVKGWHERGATASWSQDSGESVVGQFAKTRGEHATNMMDTFRSARSGAADNIRTIARQTGDLAVNTVKTVANPVTAIGERGLQGAAKVVKVGEDAVLTGGGALRTAGDNLATLGYRGATRLMDSMGGDPTEASRTKLQEEMRKRSEKFGRAGGAESPVVMELKQQNDSLMQQMQAMQEQMKQMMDMLRQGQSGEAISQLAPEQPMAPATEMPVEPVDMTSEPTDDEATIDVTSDEAVPPIELAQPVSEGPAALTSEEPMANGTANETQVGQPTVPFEATPEPVEASGENISIDTTVWKELFNFKPADQVEDAILAEHILSLLKVPGHEQGVSSEDLVKVRNVKRGMIAFLSNPKVYDNPDRGANYTQLIYDILATVKGPLSKAGVKYENSEAYKERAMRIVKPQLVAYLKRVAQKGSL